MAFPVSIPMHAVAVAEASYTARGGKVKRVGARYDQEVTRDNEKRTVEVKGTASAGEAVVHRRRGETSCISSPECP